MLVGAGLPSPATMLFNKLMKGLLPQMNRDPIYVSNDDPYPEALEACQMKNDKGKDTQTILLFLLPLQQQNRGLWKHSMIFKPNNDDHRGPSYTIQVMKTRRLITWNSLHICSDNIRGIPT